jgi:dTDP-4-dehydrorhamnose 3,5-epimerase
MLNVIPTAIPDVLVIEPKRIGDQRGFLMETYQAKDYGAVGIPEAFVQDNVSGSHQHTLRGLHMQIRHPQGKLVRVASGQIFDVAVDLRRRSVTFGQWVGVTLSSQNGLQLWVPPGFAHGFLVMSDWAEVSYKVTDYYAPEWERTLRWNDPELRISWPLQDGRAPILSAKDANGVAFSEIQALEPDR